MTWFFYWQATPESSWQIADAKLRQQIITTHKPPFVTVLDLDSDIPDGMSREDRDKVKYRGPLYFDFDAGDIEDCIGPFQKFLDNLEENDVDLRQVGLYATGGKGFHVVIPPQVFSDGMPTGARHLPAIYKEVAHALYEDCLDLRVYSARKGRMFRVENVERTNGAFKVQITPEQARSMTPDMYAQLTAQAGPSYTLAAPVLAPKLALIFTKCKDKVRKATGTKKKSRADERLVKTFSGTFPATLMMVGRGENLRDDAGFQKIATQIAISAIALGMSEADMLAACEGLIETHSGDGKRYNTPSKRRRELSRMYDYMTDNPCYEFSVGGIKSVLAEGTSTPDLDASIDDPDGVLEESEDDLDDEVTQGVVINKHGIFAKIWDKEDEKKVLKRLSNLGIGDVSALQTLEGDMAGFLVHVYLDGEFRGQRKLSANAFNSSMNVQKELGSVELAAVHASDSQSRAMMEILRSKAKRSNSVVTTIPREGVDIIRLPDSQTKQDRYQILYAGPKRYGVLVEDGEGNPPVTTPGFRLETYTGQDGDIKSDLPDAPPLKFSEESQEFFDRFFKIYPAKVMAPVLGFYSACFFSQIARHCFGVFPSLQVYGAAGTGKSTLNLLCSQMHYYNKPAQLLDTKSLSEFALGQYLQCSASIPIVLDEFKRQGMTHREAEVRYGMLRNNYTGNIGAKGRITHDSGNSNLTVARTSNLAPIVYLSEEIHNQTALIDRSIIVALTQEHRNKGVEDDRDFSWCFTHKRYLSELGSSIMRKVLRVDLDSLRQAQADAQNEVQAHSTAKDKQRPIVNYSIILLGLDAVAGVLSTVFEGRYDAIIEEHKQALLNGFGGDMVEPSQSEGSKVLNDLAFLTTVPGDSPFHLVSDQDYRFSVNQKNMEPQVEISLRLAWDKYVRWTRGQGGEPLYSNEQSFTTAMRRHSAVLDAICAGSPLKGGRPSVNVVAFSLRLLYDMEGVQEFQNMEREKILPNID